MKLKPRHLLQIMFLVFSLTSLWLLIFMSQERTALQKHSAFSREQIKQDGKMLIAAVDLNRRLIEVVNISEIAKELDMRIPPCCSPGWQGHASSCFSITKDIKKWENARQDCRSRQGDLAVVKDQEDQKFLTNFVYKFKHKLINNNSGELFHSAWIGLTDSKQEGAFVWVNGLPIDFSYWSDGEPNNALASWDDEHKGQDCVGIVPPDIIGAKNWLSNWDDITCVGTRHYVCERGATISWSSPNHRLYI